MKKHWLVTSTIVLASLAIVWTLWRGLNIDQSKIPPTLIGKPAYAFIAEWVQGREYLNVDAAATRFDLSQLRGKPLVLNFWASWCVSCKEEALELEAFWQEYRGKGVNVVGIAIQDQQDAAMRFAAEYGKTYMLGLDFDGRISIDYGVTGVPETFIIDKGGTIVHKEVGPVSAAMLAKEISKLL